MLTLRRCCCCYPSKILLLFFCIVYSGNVDLFKRYSLRPNRKAKVRIPRKKFNFLSHSLSKAVLFASLSGLTEPLSVIFGGLLFSSLITPFFVNFCLAFVAGVMISLVIFELIPISVGEKNFSVYVTAGMVVTAIPMILFG